MDSWLFIERLSDFLPDKDLVSLSGVNKDLNFYLNQGTIWKRRYKKYVNDKEVDDWKREYIRLSPVLVVPIKTERYHVEYKSHPTGCFMRHLSSSEATLHLNYSYEVDGCDIEYYIISIDRVEKRIEMVPIYSSGDKKYYTRKDIRKYKIIDRNNRYIINVHIQGHGLLVIPWKDI